MTINSADFDLQVLWRYEVVYRGNVQAETQREAEHKAASTHANYWPVEITVEPRESEGNGKTEGHA